MLIQVTVLLDLMIIILIAPHQAEQIENLQHLWYSIFLMLMVLFWSSQHAYQSLYQLHYCFYCNKIIRLYLSHISFMVHPAPLIAKAPIANCINNIPSGRRPEVKVVMVVLIFVVSVL